jgi:hypothetical protein
VYATPVFCERRSTWARHQSPYQQLYFWQLQAAVLKPCGAGAETELHTLAGVVTENGHGW